LEGYFDFSDFSFNTWGRDFGLLKCFGLDKDGLEGGEGRGIFSQNSNNL
jgi:hypothetical protein